MKFGFFVSRVYLDKTTGKFYGIKKLFGSDAKNMTYNAVFIAFPLPSTLRNVITKSHSKPTAIILGTKKEVNLCSKHLNT